MRSHPAQQHAARALHGIGPQRGGQEVRIPLPQGIPYAAVDDGALPCHAQQVPEGAAAAVQRRAGADMTSVKRMFQNSFDEYMQRERVISCARSTAGGIVIAVADFQTSRPIAAQAADELLNIIGVRASIVAFPLGDDIVVSARSMGSVNVQIITEMLGGGGSLTAAGAQMKNTDNRTATERIYHAVETYLECQSAQEDEETQ